MDQELKIYLNGWQLLDSLERALVLAFTVLLDVFFDRLIQNWFYMIYDLLKYFVMIFWEDYQFEEWLDCAENIISVRSYLESHYATDAFFGTFIVTAFLINLLLFLRLMLFLLRFLYYAFVNQHIVSFEFITSFDMVQFLFAPEVYLRDQGVFNIKNYGLMSTKDLILLDFIL